jgi:hypothetical protein
MNGDKKQSGLSWSQPARQDSGPAQKNEEQSKNSPAKSSATASGSWQPGVVGAAQTTSRLIGVFVIGLVLGGLFTYTITSFSDGESEITVPQGAGVGEQEGESSKGDSTAAGNIDTSTAVLGGSSDSIASGVQSAELSLLVANQAPGMSVSVGGVRVSAPTWVTVYDSVNGEPMGALGAKMFFPENNGKAGTIPLLRPTVAGKTYLIGGRLDNGDHEFSGATDSAVVKMGGERVLYEFNTL